MEDKRTLLAFLLIGLILLAIPYYYELVGLSQNPQPVEEEAPSPTLEEQQQQKEVLPPATPAPVTTPPAEKVPDQPAQSLDTPFYPASFTPREIVVLTPLQRMVFSTEGGVLKSVQLTKYNQLNTEMVELIPPGGRGLVLSLEHLGNEQDLSRIEFIPDREKISIGPQEEATLRLRAALGDRRFLEKVLTFNGDHYGVEMDFRYHGIDEDTRVLVGWENGIANTEKAGSGSDLPGGIAGAQEVGAVAFMNEERITVDDEESIDADEGLLKWAGVSSQYFFLALAPLDPGHYRFELYGQIPGEVFEWEKYSYRIGKRITGTGTWKILVYPGPLDYEELSTYQVDLERGIDLGWPIIRDISKVLLIIFLEAHNYVPNYGWVLILFAVAIKILVYPLTHKSYSSMARMQEVQPKIAALREKYKNDNQRLSQATMKLYKEEGVNPVGGCLPMLLQMPIFFALYKLFYNIELRQAPFILWITDLSRPDEIDIAGFGLHILPLLMAGSMLIQQKMTMKDPKQAFLVYLMPAFLLFIFWNLPSGLVLYWSVFNILSIGQQMLINHLKAAPPTGSAPGQA